ncbi:MAG: phosphoserine phosphatase SerB [Rhodospirillales bacterium]|nr:phosphoserine phosphatase SerB [Rhodospirillales bacterium]
MDNVLTLVSADPSRPAEDYVAQICSQLARAGAEIGRQSWLAEDKACDIFFTNLSLDAAATLVRQALATAPVDALTQATANRRKKLLVADMDSTIVAGETLDDLAELAGIGAKIAAITARAMNGEIPFRDALRERVAMLRGVDAGYLEETAQALRLNPGAEILIGTLSAAGVHTALVSGGFDFFTARVARQLGFEVNKGNRIEIVNNRFTGEILAPVITKDVKRQTLVALAAEHRIAMIETLAVGDGANDLPMLQAAGLGVAYYAKPVVVAAARAQVAHTDLTTLLYYQGYGQSAFVSPPGSVENQ